MNDISFEEISCKKQRSNIVKKGLKQYIWCFLLGKIIWFKYDNFLAILIAFIEKYIQIEHHNSIELIT